MHFGLTKTQGRQGHGDRLRSTVARPRPTASTPIWRRPARSGDFTGGSRCTRVSARGRWHFLETFDREITRERFVAAVRSRASQARGTITSGTATNHVDVFLRTYAGSEYADGAPGETLGSPFQELDLLRTAAPAGKPTVRFLRGPKRTLDAKALAFVLEDFWRCTAPGSATLSLRSLMLSHAAPGAVLLLDEPGLYDKIEELCSRSRWSRTAERRWRRLRPDKRERPVART